jgi:hypothetical protein
MLAGQQHRSSWSREGGPFDILAIAISLIVIVGGIFIVHSASLQYRMQGTPVVSAAPIVVLMAIPNPSEKLEQ